MEVTSNSYSVYKQDILLIGKQVRAVLSESESLKEDNWLFCDVLVGRLNRKQN